MNRIRRILPAVVALLGFRSEARAQAPADDQAGKQLRQMVLGTTAKDLGLAASPQFPRVFGVVMDWPVGAQIASVVALADGTASLYTTSTFGIIGGQAHESVRKAGRAFIGVAERYFEDATRTTSHPYPAEGKIAFYLLCYDGTRVLGAALEPTQAGSSKHAALFGAGQEVLTQLRKTVGR